MYKFLIAAILCVPVSLRASDVTFAVPAVSAEHITATLETLSSTVSVRGYTIATQSATSVIFDTGAAFRFVDIQNLDTGADIACSETSSVMATAASGTVGFFIGRVVSNVYYSKRFALRAGQNFYCRSNATGSTAGSRAAVMTGR